VAIAIMAALREEIDSLLSALRPSDLEPVRVGGREFVHGTLHGEEVVLGLSGCGKVAAAITATQMIERFRPRQVWFTGVAGALWPDLRVGDVVIGDGLIQHDMDARPLFPRFEVPFTGRSRIQADPALIAVLKEAAEGFVRDQLASAVSAATRARLGIGTPRVVVGDIATGDRFMAAGTEARALAALVPACACVEMEGAAVAQACAGSGVPFAVLRVISDVADEGAGAGFAAFIEGAASVYSGGIVARALTKRL